MDNEDYVHPFILFIRCGFINQAVGVHFVCRKYSNLLLSNNFPCFSNILLFLFKSMSIHENKKQILLINFAMASIKQVRKALKSFFGYQRERSNLIEMAGKFQLKC